ncbi:MAG: sigma-70 family RNA polymerase sigma factor [Deltaproteobacteria bacterium]|nr:sigma-70 family RNA polymerase sigma factor [Deltaproteobacteria bacterium]
MLEKDGVPPADEQNSAKSDLQSSQLVTLVYGQLRALAHGYLKKESRNRPLQTTALVHEAYLRLAERNVSCKDRTHFVAVAATTMRRVLVDLARERASRKRGANAIHLSLDDAQVGKAEAVPDVLILDQLMTRLEAIDPRKARAIELRIFGGLTTDEAAESLQISRATLERDLRFAKAWLGRELRTSAPTG